jgi:hypothetical protein
MTKATWHLSDAKVVWQAYYLCAVICECGDKLIVAVDVVTVCSGCRRKYKLKREDE